MQRLILALILATMMGAAGPVAAETAYVTDSFQITLRTGPSNENKILAMLPSGTRLEVLEKGEGWSRVQAEGGKEGWVPSQYVKPDLPKKAVVERLQKENERLRETAEQATARAKELAGQEQELSRITQEYTSLQANAQNAANLKSRLDAAAAQLKNVTAEKEALAVATRELRSEVRMRWFLTGAGVVGGSWLLGFVMGRLQRKNRRSTLS